MNPLTALARLALVPLLILFATPATRAQSASPAIAGLAHVALSVSSLPASRDFYRKLGLEEAFHFGEGDAISQSFLKINDRQFLELYPTSPRQPVGFLHLCFEGTDLDALHDFDLARGLAPIAVRKARAGNLLFTAQGPEKQNIEYTEYLPGSLHSEDHGKHLESPALSRDLFAVALPMQDRSAARSFYVDKLAFTPVPGHPWLVEIPGASHQQLLFETGDLLPHGRLFFRVDDLKATAATLKRLGIPATSAANTLSVTDPDGNLLVFQTAADAEPLKP